MPSRVAAVLALLLLVQACAGLRTTDEPAAVAHRPAACVAENQSCDHGNRCCAGMSCVPQGRLGWLCRHPYVD